MNNLYLAISLRNVTATPSPEVGGGATLITLAGRNGITLKRQAVPRPLFCFTRETHLRNKTN